MDRRHFLRHAAFISGTSLFSLNFQSLLALAQAGASNPRFFIFAFASGGWDVTQVFEPKVGLQTIDVDPNGDVATVNGITFLDSPNREAVRRFFTDFGAQSCIVNGINTRSVSHSVGTEIMMTGLAGSNSPDWPTIVAMNKGRDLVLPHLAISGPVFSGTLGAGTASGAGFFNLLLGGETHTATAEATFDAYHQRRLDMFLARSGEEGRTGIRQEELVEGFARWKELRSLKSQLGFGDLNNFGDEGIALATAFQRGFSTTGTLGTPGSWDTHSNNNGTQNNSFQQTFDQLHRIVTFLAGQPGTNGTGTLLDQTTIVVMSEMGRTPKLNNSNGKDHWPYTSVLLAGGGIKGGQVVGATDEYQNGLPINLATGLVDAAGSIPAAGNLGAALLILGGLNPDNFLPAGTPVLNAVLA